MAPPLDVGECKVCTGDIIIASSQGERVKEQSLNFVARLDVRLRTTGRAVSRARSLTAGIRVLPRDQW